MRVGKTRGKRVVAEPPPKGVGDSQDTLSASYSSFCPTRDLDTVESVRQKLGDLTDLHGLRR